MFHKTWLSYHFEVTLTHLEVKLTHLEVKLAHMEVSTNNKLN